MAHRSALAILLLVVFLWSASAAADEGREVSDTDLDAAPIRALYSWPARAWMESLYAVGRPASKLYGYAIFESPELASGFLTRGPAGVGAQVAKDAIFEAAENLIGHPEAAAEGLASAMMERGLEAYRRNYSRYRDWKQAGTLSASERENFRKDSVDFQYYALGKDLWSDVQQFKHDAGKYEDGTAAASKTLGILLDQLAELAKESDAWDIATTAARVKGLVDEAQEGLQSYPPYLAHVQRAERLESLDDLDLPFAGSDAAQESSPPSTASVSTSPDGPAKTALRRVLPRLRSAWNEGGIGEIAALCHPKNDFRKVYENPSPREHTAAQWYRREHARLGDLVEWELLAQPERPESSPGEVDVFVRLAFEHGTISNYSMELWRNADGAWLLGNWECFRDVKPQPNEVPAVRSQGRSLEGKWVPDGARTDDLMRETGEAEQPGLRGYGKTIEEYAERGDYLNFAADGTVAGKEGDRESHEYRGSYHVEKRDGDKWVLSVKVNEKEHRAHVRWLDDDHIAVGFKPAVVFRRASERPGEVSKPQAGAGAAGARPSTDRRDEERRQRLLGELEGILARALDLNEETLAKIRTRLLSEYGVSHSADVEAACEQVRARHREWLEHALARMTEKVRPLVAEGRFATARRAWTSFRSTSPIGVDSGLKTDAGLEAVDKAAAAKATTILERAVQEERRSGSRAAAAQLVAELSNFEGTSSHERIAERIKNLDASAAAESQVGRLLWNGTTFKRWPLGSDWRSSHTSVQAAQGRVRIGTGGGMGDHGALRVGMRLLGRGALVEARLRLVAGGRNYRLPYEKVEFEDGTSIAATFLPSGSSRETYGWSLSGWTGNERAAVPGEGYWVRTRLELRPDGGRLWVKADDAGRRWVASDFTLVAEAAWAHTQIAQISFEQPWDSECEVEDVHLLVPE